MIKTRTGFKRKELAPDWSIDGDFLCWKNPTNSKIKVADLREISFDLPDVQQDASTKITFSKLKPVLKSPSSLKADERNAIIDFVGRSAHHDFFKIAPLILSNNLWNDLEKLDLIRIKFNNLNGFKNGQDAQRILCLIRWSTTSARERLNLFFDFCKDNLDLSENVLQDQSNFNSFRNTIVLYRGFNVPINETIRNKNVNTSWLRQETGKSVFFTRSENVAKWFACTQKLYSIQKIRSAQKLSSTERGVLGGRLCIAKYHCNVDDITLYQNKIARSEDEVIVLPSKTLLKSYKFLGFDDFIKTIHGKRFDQFW